MKVLLVNTAERIGGAAIAAHRLMEALNKEGIEAKMLVRDKQTDNPNVVPIPHSWRHKFQFIWERLVIWANNHLHRENLFEVDIANVGNDITHLKVFQEADIIHLHWINQGMLSLKDINNIIKTGKPIVWTMHDMWPFTGICHHATTCTYFTSHCHHCPMLLKGCAKDLSFRTFKQKKSIWKEAHITFVACSRWLEGQAYKGSLLSGQQLTCIPNAVNMQIFKPSDQTDAREKLQLPTNKKLILFGSMKATDKRKGIDYMVSACQTLIQKYPDLKEKLGLVILGGKSDELVNLFPFPTYSTGYVKEEKQLARIYNAVDVYVTPSLQENLPNTIAESLSCGTPCVGFNIGGIPEMINHKQNGYVARYKSADDLAEGIGWTITKADCKSLRKNALQKARETYSGELVAQQYIKVYQSITNRHA